MTRDAAENLMLAADAAEELAAAMIDDDCNRFMENLAVVDAVFARVDPIVQTKLDFCTGLEVLCNIPVRY